MLYDPKWKKLQPTDEPIIKRTDIPASALELLLRVRQAMIDGKITDEHFIMDQKWCGTQGCIFGWMHQYAIRDHLGHIESNKLWYVARQKIYPNGRNSMAIFDRLFYPIAVEGICIFDMDNEDVTVQDAVRAIDNFLAGEEYPWKDWKPSK